ncbi:octopamine receptor-like [Arctopsyche grandis]|uniref:octopamine receptor-like n=1 Tax=Arctopsyche grandis TaxID=121162 RepID=UPI00406D7564
MEIYLDIDCNNTAINDSILNYTASCNSTSTVTQLEIISLTISRLFMIIFLSAVIVSTITGNTLVVLAVFTTKKLRSITNFFVTNLAVADFLVGLFVMPPAVTSLITGSWQLGERVCDVWITLDVLLCTASILSLCAISIDRYLAVTQPLRYSRQKRSKKLAGVMIFAVWVISLAITCPPILGWSSKQEADCHYNQSPGYVIFSAMGSFFIPMMIMVFVYFKISSVVSRRHRQLSSEVIRKPKVC